MKIDPYYQRRRCSPMTLDTDNIQVCADIRGGSQDLCKFFFFDFVPAPMVMHALVIFKFKSLVYGS